MLKNQMEVEFSSYLDMDSRCPWRLFIMNAGDMLRLNVTIPGGLPKEKALDRILSGCFNQHVPDIVEEWHWWVEKW